MPIIRLEKYARGHYKQSGITLTGYGHSMTEITCHKVISTSRSIVLVSLVHVENLPYHRQVQALTSFTPVVL